MALSYVFGTVGSGKTYDMLVRMMDDMVAGHEVITINCRLKLPLVKKYLIEQRGMQPYNADNACAWHRTITTESEFRMLQGLHGRRVKLYADEAHFWWPSNSHYSLNINDVFSIAMSRKRSVDVHMISQRFGQINRDIAGYCQEVWKAMVYNWLPIKLICRARTLLAPLTGDEPRPVAFVYLRAQGDLGKETVDIDKAAYGSKRIRYLQPSIAGLYETAEIVSSPVLDRLRREAELEYLRDVLFNRIRPSMPCPDCNGTRRRVMGLMFDHSTGEPYRCVASPANMMSEWFIRTTGDEPCGSCAVDGVPMGYTYPQDHPDFAEAEKVRAYFTSDGKRKTARPGAN